MFVDSRFSEAQHNRQAVRWNQRTIKNWLSFGILAGPALVVFIVFMMYPLGNMFRVSTLEWRGMVRPQTSIGLENYERLFTQDREFQAALSNTAKQIFVALPGTMFPAFVLGFFLSLRLPGYRMYRTIYFSPVMLAAPGVSMLFLGLYLPNGIVNTFLTQIGLESWTRVWLANVETSLWAVTAVDLWAGIGFYTMLFYGILSNIPHDLYEAAMIDGAGLWAILWRIVFPMSLEFFGMATMLHFMWLLLGSAQNVLLLTEGGPGTSSLTLGYMLYKQAFQVRNLGYSQAIGVIIFFIGLVGMLFIRLLTGRKYE